MRQEIPRPIGLKLNQLVTEIKGYHYKDGQNLEDITVREVRQALLTYAEKHSLSLLTYLESDEAVINVSYLAWNIATLFGITSYLNTPEDHYSFDLNPLETTISQAITQRFERNNTQRPQWIVREKKETIASQPRNSWYEPEIM
jgi:hypothetical protein